MTLSDNTRFTTVVQFHDPVMRDHTVHGVRIMPGVTYLDMIYRILATRQVETDRVTVHDILFKTALAVTETCDRRLRFLIQRETDRSWSVTAASRPTDADDHEPWEEHLTCRLQLDSAVAEAPAIDPDSFRRAAEHILDMEEAYAFARKVEIVHGPFMKGLGPVYIGPDALMAELHLGEEARHHLQWFLLHPAYLDASTLTPFLFNREDVAEPSPFIPIHIAAFRAVRPLGERCFVLVPRPDASAVTADAMAADILFFDEQGRFVAGFTRLTAKRIRSAELITRLQQRTQPRPAPSPVREKPSPSPPPPAVSGSASGSFREDLRQMLANLLDCAVDAVSDDTGFYDQGLDSTDLLKLVRELETRLGEKLYPTLLFEYTTIHELAEYLDANYPQGSMTEAQPESRPRPSRVLYFREVWSEKPYTRGPIPESMSLLIFGNAAETAETLRLALQARSCDARVTLIKPGRRFHQSDDQHFTLDPKSPDDYLSLVRALATLDRFPTHIIHHWSGKRFVPLDSAMNAQLCRGPISLLYLARALQEQQDEHETPVHLLYAHAPDHPIYASAAGATRTIGLENPRLVFRHVTWSGEPADLVDELLWGTAEEAEVRLGDGQRRVRQMEGFELPHDDPTASPQKDEDEVYLITGGAGGLGLLFAKYLVQQHGVRVALVGRSEAKDSLVETLAAWNEEREVAHYFRADLSERKAVSAMVDAVKQRFGRLDGVIHAAGIVRDALIRNKTPDEIQAVLAAKVYGTVYLDEATRGEDLRFFVFFSSIAAVLGNPGQADYAIGNRFMDAYAALRTSWCTAGRRSGRTLSINWPLWRSGGMAVDEETERALDRLFGLRLLEEQDGLSAFEHGLATEDDHFLVLDGVPERVYPAFGLTVPDGLVSPDQPEPVATATPAPGPPPPEPTTSAAAIARAALASPHASPGDGPTGTPSPVREPIAIIGMAGRYPMANDLNAFWENLSQGRDCISEVPADRWDVDALFDPDRGKIGAVYSRWGGFLEDVDKFDPLFFNISPKRAAAMDPQERLFLETAWHTLEDAGYTPAATGGAVGVFVGVMWSQYQLFGVQGLAEAGTATSIFASIANNVSYCFDFTGPSIALDTMCSSSLTALHLARESILRGECTMALAGGVNVSVHPEKYRFLCRNQMVSSDGRCRSFGEGGDGYVPGEGVGAVLLKPLSQARTDRDHIYAVILASALNHGGTTSGYSVPSPKAQGTLIGETLAQAGIDPQTIGYVETHGTGTSLGQVGTISANGEAEIGQMIAKAMQKVGKEGVITVEEAKSLESELDVVEGMQFDRGYLSRRISSPTPTRWSDRDGEPLHPAPREEAVWPSAHAAASRVRSCRPASPLLIIAEDVEGEALATLVVNKLRGGLKVAAVKAPGFGDRRKAMLEDIAILTGGQVISEDLGIKLESMSRSTCWAPPSAISHHQGRDHRSSMAPARRSRNGPAAAGRSAPRPRRPLPTTTARSSRSVWPSWRAALPSCKCRRGHRGRGEGA